MTTPSSFPPRFQLPAQDVLTQYLKGSFDSLGNMVQKDALIQKIAELFAQTTLHERGIQQSLFSLLVDAKVDLPEPSLQALSVTLSKKLIASAEGKKTEEEGKKATTTKKDSASPVSVSKPVIEDSISVAFDPPAS